MNHSKVIDTDTYEKLKALDFPEKNHNSDVIILHKNGDGIRVPEVFNVQVHKNSKGVLKQVTNDPWIVDALIDGKEFSGEGKRIIWIDDVGEGYPLGGALCGVYDEQTELFYSKEIELDYFKGEKYQRKEHRIRYAERVLEIIGDLDIDKSGTIIRICSGPINEIAKNGLRENGFEVVPDTIGDPLESWLDDQYHQYQQDMTGFDLYMDVKKFPKPQRPYCYWLIGMLTQIEGLGQFAKTGQRFGSEIGKPISEDEREARIDQLRVTLRSMIED